MKSSFLPVACFVILAACDGSRKPKETELTIPKALQIEKSAYPEIESRSYKSGNMVDELYDDLVSKTPLLQQIEKKITDLNENGRDSTSAFYKFDANNTTYYRSAETNLSRLKDTVLRDNILESIQNSIGEYNKRVSVQKNLVIAIKNKEINLQDLHVVLKVVKTLPVIEKYQKENQPPSKQLQGYADQLDSTANNVNSIIKK